MQIGAKGIQFFFHDYDIKKTLKIHRSKRAHFHPSLLVNKLNKF
jgi:hypothetical protein